MKTPTAPRGRRGQIPANSSTNSNAAASPPRQLEVTVSPIGRRGRFRAEIAGRIIVDSSKQPFLDGARVLISEGYARAIILAMWHANATAFALRSTIGAAAKLAVEDDGTPRFRRWKPWDGSPGSAPNHPAGVWEPPDALASPEASYGKGAGPP
jgi:hypothetical protein